MDCSYILSSCFLAIIGASILVAAQQEGDVRLVGGTSELEGRVEVYHGNQWGTVCDNYWDFVDASVVCRQLGYNHANGAPDRAYFGEGPSSQPVFLEGVKCSGSETRLVECRHFGWGVTECGHGRDAGVICTNSPVFEGEVRLSDGARLEEGRVEIYHVGRWGTVCNDFWGKDEARVVCHQLGYNGYTYYKADYGPGIGPIHLDNVDCIGYESSLIYCFHSSWGVHDCSHEEDVGVRCSRPGSSPPMSWWLWFIIIFGSLCVLGITLGLLKKCCRTRKQKRKQPGDTDPAAADPMIDANSSSAQIYVPGGSSTPSMATFVPLQPFAPTPTQFSYPPASTQTQGGAALPYPPAQGGTSLPYPPGEPGGLPMQSMAVPPTYDESQRLSQSQTDLLQAGQATASPNDEAASGQQPQSSNSEGLNCEQSVSA